MRRKEVIVVTAIAVTALLLTVITSVYPVPVDFWPQNPFWNGLYGISSVVSNVSYGDLRTFALTADPNSSVIAVIGPSKDFSPEEVDAVMAFLMKGGEVIVADDFGTGNQLLAGLDLPVVINGSLLVDPLFNSGAPELPKVWWGDKPLVLNYASVLQPSGQGSPHFFDALAIVNSSAFSYLDVNLDGEHDSLEPEGSFVIAAKVRIGEGSVVIISDPSIFINTMLDDEFNEEFIQYIVGNKTLLVDSSHLEETPLTRIKEVLYAVWTFMNYPEVKYGTAFLLTLLFAELAARFKDIIKTGRDELKRSSGSILTGARTCLRRFGGI